MTLIELLLVIALAALVLGMGLGSIASLDVGGRTALGLVQTTLRSANDWAVARRAPARVRIDRAAGTITAEGLDVIGTWHFESDPPKGAFGLDGDLVGAELVADGFLGRAVSFRGMGSNAHVQIPVQRESSYDLRQGFQIQLAIRPEKDGSGAVLKIGHALGIDVGRHLDVEAWFAAVRETETGERVSAGKARARTEEGALRLGEWNRVLVSYDRSRLAVFVEGLPAAAIEESAEVAPVDGALILGGGERPWQGALDSLVISAVASEETVELPKTCAFSKETPASIAFAAGGGLDRSVHTEPVKLALEFLDGRRVEIQVNLYGTVE